MLVFKPCFCRVDKREGVESEAHTVPDPDPARARPPAFSRLGAKIILLVFAATFVTAMLVSWISIQSTSQSLRGMIERFHPSSLSHAGQRVGPWIDAIRLQLLQYAAHHSAEDASATASDLAVLDGLAIFDEAGKPVRAWGTVPVRAGAALTANERLATLELEAGRFALAIAPRWKTNRIELVGVVSFARLAPMLETELPGPDSFLAIVDGEGRVLARAGTPPGGAELERIELKAFHSGGELRESDLAGTHVIGAAQRLDLLDYHVVIITPFDAAYGPVLSVVTRVFLIDLGIILLFSFLAYRVAARVVQPIGYLSDAARRATEGDTDLELPELHTRDEIGLLTRTFNDMVRRQHRHREEIEETNRHLTDRNARLQQANEVLNQLSITDGLTKLHNHRFFQDHLTREIRRVDRTKEPLSILIIDIDDFKRLNDRQGHAAGDEILLRIAQILNGTIRGSDLCARYGGEEFVVLAPNTDVQGAYGLAEKVRTAITESSFIVDDSLRPLRVTVSIGVAGFGGNRKRFFQKADQALYQAKANGKNCVVAHEDDLPEQA